MTYLIYSVEDDENISFLINKTLSNSGYAVKSFTNGVDLFKELEKEIPSILLLDMMLPGESGVDIVKKIRNSTTYKEIHIIIVSAKTSELDKVTALDAGADDYMTKPFGVLELTSKINAYLRKHEKTVDVLKCRDVTLNVNERTCYKGKEEIKLTSKEFQLLKFLLESKPNVVAKEEILKEIWGYSYVGESRTVDMHIKSLRQKLNDNSENKMISTVHSVGYKIEE